MDDDPLALIADACASLVVAERSRVSHLRAVCRIFCDRIDAAARNILEGARSGSEASTRASVRAGTSA
jgi:hypothetical protein